MILQKWTFPPQSLLDKVINFISYNKMDMDVFIASINRTTIFTVEEQNKLIGTISIIWKPGTLPIEAAITTGNKPFTVEKNSVEIAGLKIDADPSATAKLLRIFDAAVYHETLNYHKYITCHEKFVGIYKRRGFSIVDTITFDGITPFIAMWKL